MADNSEPTAKGGSGNGETSDLKPKLIVIGVGGAGCNAVDNMIRSQLEGVEFVAANTDAQSLKVSVAEYCIQMGVAATHGLGTGGRVELGRAAAEESIDQIEKMLEGSSMVFIAAGLGGGTGTGAAPVIAQAAREQGILTVGVISMPFEFEGGRRRRAAEAGLDELEQFVDTMIVIPNQNLFKIADENTSFVEAFKMADDVLYSAVKGITDLIVLPGLVNLDFADIQAVMKETGKAVIATGEAEGDGRALEAAEKAIANPLLDSPSIRGARGLLINITGGRDMTLFEVDVAANRVRAEVDDGCLTIFGSTLDESLKEKIRVSVVASGIGAPEIVMQPPGESPGEEEDEETGRLEAAAEDPPLPLLETAEGETDAGQDGDDPRSDAPAMLDVPPSTTMAEPGEPRSESAEKIALDRAPASGAEKGQESSPGPPNNSAPKDTEPFLAAVLAGVKAANPEPDGEGRKGLLGRVSRLFKG